MNNPSYDFFFVYQSVARYMQYAIPHVVFSILWLICTSVRTLVVCVCAFIDSRVRMNLQFNVGCDRLTRDVLQNRNTSSWYAITSWGENYHVKTKIYYLAAAGIESKPHGLASKLTRYQTLPRPCFYNSIITLPLHSLSKRFSTIRF